MDGELLPCVLVENKADLLEEGQVNNLTSLKEFADVNKFDECFRTSAKTGLNINESMKYLIESILKRMSKITSNDFSPDRISGTFDPSKHNNNANLRSQQKGECC